MFVLKVSAIENGLGIILPTEVLTRLNVTPGDTLYTIDTPDGVILTRSDPGPEDHEQPANP
jgi:putative addiction module antidote